MSDEKKADRDVLAMLYAIGDAPTDIEREDIILRMHVDPAHTLAALERLRRDRLIELLGPAGGPYSYRLSPAARACLDAVRSI